MISRQAEVRMTICTLFGAIALVATASASSLSAQRAPRVAPAGPDSLVITFLANEGVMLSSGGTTVLIDALFGDGLRGYGIVTQPTRTALERGQPPFDRVNAVLATHVHNDTSGGDSGRSLMVAARGMSSTPRDIGVRRAIGRASRRSPR
jgi:hypothetical protein